MKFIKKMLLVVALSIFAFLLVSCSNNDNSTNVPLTPASISAPTNMVIYEVEIHPDGVPMQTFTVKDEYDPFKVWQEKQKLNEDLDEYNTKKALWDKEKKEQEDGKFWSEEDRIKDYCKENGYLKCITIKDTCLEDGCHKVTIECEDSEFDPSKLKWCDYDPDKECEKYNIVVDESVAV